MKIKTKQADLSAALSKLKGVVPAKPAVPTLSFVKVTASADGKGVSFVGTDLKLLVSVKMECEADAGEDKAILLPFAMLHSIVQTAPGGDLTIECRDGGKASIKTATGLFRLQSLESEQFPPFKRDEDESKVTLPCSDLVEMLSRTKFAQAKPTETRNSLKSALIDIGKDGVVCVATNGRALAKVESDGCKDAPQQTKVVVPQGAVYELLRLAPSEGDVQIVIPASGKYAIFAFKGAVLKTTLVDEQYPNWRQVMPSGDCDEVTVNSTSLVNAIKRASVLLSGLEVQYVTLTFRREQITVTTPQADYGDATEKVRCEGSEGKEFYLSFDGNLLSDALAAAGAEKVILSHFGGGRPIVISDGKRFYGLVMPMRVQ